MSLRLLQYDNPEAVPPFDSLSVSNIDSVVQYKRSLSRFFEPGIHLPTWYRLFQSPYDLIFPISSDFSGHGFVLSYAKTEPNRYHNCSYCFYFLHFIFFLFASFHSWEDISGGPAPDLRIGAMFVVHASSNKFDLHELNM